MTTEKLYEFLVLSKVLNYSKAAENLYISQSILTKHIQEMEKEFQTILFQRSTHGVTLTEAGRLLSERVQPLIDKCSNAVNISQLKNLPVNGFIHIACALEISYAAHIKIFLDQFTKRYPGIHIDFEVKSEGTPENFVNDYDFVFTPCEYHNLAAGICQHLICTHGTYVVLPPAHPLMSKSLLQLRDLEGETFIVPFAHELFGPYAQNWLLTEKYTHGKVRCISASNLPTALFMASVGKGVIIIPRYVKNILPNDTFAIGIANKESCFHEYLYFNSSLCNSAAKLFYEEFRAAYLRKI